MIVAIINESSQSSQTSKSQERSITTTAAASSAAAASCLSEATSIVLFVAGFFDDLFNDDRCTFIVRDYGHFRAAATCVRINGRSKFAAGTGFDANRTDAIDANSDE